MWLRVSNSTTSYRNYVTFIPKKIERDIGISLDEWQRKHRAKISISYARCEADLKKVKIVKKGEARLANLIREAKRAKEIGDCGAIVAFIGFVREKARDGSKVKELYIEAYEEKAKEALRKIREEILEDQQVKEVIIQHVVDTLAPREDILYIVVAGRGRRDAFRAAREVLERVKKEAPIWKKEITEKGEYWVSETRV